MKADIIREVALGAGVTAHLKKSLLVIKGPKGEISRDFPSPRVAIVIDGSRITLTALKGTKREKTVVGTFRAHILNMIKGVQDPYVYTLKICSGHFPMNVAVVGKEFVIKNFLGEAVPRKAGIVAGADVKVSGNDITVSSPDRELAGLMASRIENL